MHQFLLETRKNSSKTGLVFTISTALSRLSGGVRNLFVTSQGTLSSGQQLQLVNEILEEWYKNDSWRGVREVVGTLATSGGILTLAAGYLRADKRFNVTTDGHEGCFYEIKKLDYQSQPGGPGYFDVTKAGCLGVAIDLGDSTGGVRRYQLTGSTAALDALTFSAVLRKRYVYATDTATTVIPDCFPALELSVMARVALSEGDLTRSRELQQEAYALLDADLGQFEEGGDFGVMPIDRLCAAPNYNAI